MGRTKEELAELTEAMKEKFAEAMDKIKAAGLANIGKTHIEWSRSITANAEPDRNEPYHPGGSPWKTYIADDIVTVTITVSMPPDRK